MEAKLVHQDYPLPSGEHPLLGQSLRLPLVRFRFGHRLARIAEAQGTSVGVLDVAEIERIQDVEIVEVGPLVHGEALMDEHEISGELTSGSSQVMAGALRMARALEHARVRGTFQSVHTEHGLEKSQAYNLARVWREYGDKVLDGTLSSRVESLSPSHLITALRAEDPIQALEEAADEGLSVKQMDTRIGEREEPENVETVETEECPSCGADSRFWQRVPGGVA